MFPKIIFPLLMVLVSALPAQADTIRVDNPAGDFAMAPGVTMVPGESGAVLSWIERQDEQHILKFSRFEGGQFGEADEIARGSNWFANWADTPAVHVRPDGTWVAHWLEKSASATYAYDVRVALSSDAGENWSDPQTPHDDGTSTEHGFVSYFSAGDRRTGIVWLDGRETGAGGHGKHAHSGFMTLRTARIDPGGEIGANTLLDDSVCDCCQTAAGTTALGPIIAYRDRTEDEIRDIAVVRRTTDGWTDPQLVHDDGWQIGGCPVNGPSLIARDSHVVVAWFTMADETPSVRFAISDDAGASFAPPATRSPGSALGRVQLAWIENGFALSWMADGNSGATLRIARYSLDGTLKRESSVTRVDRSRVSGFPRMAAVDDKLLLTWTTTGREGGPEGGPDDGARRLTRVMTALIDQQ